jgi:hypothetical protein
MECHQDPSGPSPVWAMAALWLWLCLGQTCGQRLRMKPTFSTFNPLPFPFHFRTLFGVLPAPSEGTIMLSPLGGHPTVPGTVASDRGLVCFHFCFHKGDKKTLQARAKFQLGQCHQADSVEKHNPTQAFYRQREPGRRLLSDRARKPASASAAVALSLHRTIPPSRNRPSMLVTKEGAAFG